MIETRSLGANGPAVGRIGYGAMVLEGTYGAVREDDAVRTIERALDAGMTMIDTADMYGHGRNEILVGSAIRSRRKRAFVATKFGLVFEDGVPGTECPTGWGFSNKINGRPRYAKRALDASLGRLKVDAIDLWTLHYPDPDVPIEETVDAMSDGIRAGKTRHLGLSNVTAEETRRAHAVHPIAAVQWEYSLWRREPETDLLPTLRELGIALVAWSPLGAGFFAGELPEIGRNDFRNLNPRFSAENLPKNRDRFAPLLDLAKGLGITPAELALAWLLHRGEDVFPIPGTRRPERVDENARAADVRLDEATLRRIDEIARPGLATGETLVPAPPE